MTVGEVAQLLHPFGVVRWLTNPHQQWCTESWGFHTEWGCIDAWDHRLGSRFVEIVEIWKNF